MRVIVLLQTEAPPPKRQRLDGDFDRRHLQQEMYPIEKFAPNLISEDDFFPRMGDKVLYRRNPALNKGTAFFTSGYWRHGTCTGFVQTAGCGTQFLVIDSISGQTYEVNRHQLMKDQ